MIWELILASLIVVITLRKTNVLVYYLRLYGYYLFVLLISTLLMPYFLLKPRNVLNLL